jgi:aspartate/tyrosine/aromatic aminotransferase
MFRDIQPAPPDPILGLTEAFRNDSRSEKINLSVGIYQDESGNTPVLNTVVEAGRRLAAHPASKKYLPIDGAPEFAAAVQRLMFGQEHEVLQSARAATSHTPGGTGALRVAADVIHENLPKARVWLTEPTWPNHPSIFAAAGVSTNSFPYFNAASNGLAFEQMCDAISQMPAGDVILLHGGCHNPTGVDPTPDEWSRLADLVYRRRLLPLVDFAYQGFADGIDEDAIGLRTLCRPGEEMLVCSSFSKNFGLYSERVGALTVIGSDARTAKNVQSQVKRSIRANYSNPPAHGGQLVVTILGDAELAAEWEQEVAQMRARINGMRKLFVETLAAKGAAKDYSFIAEQRGMFSFSGLTPDEVDALREKYAIYAVRSGRINVAGITPSNVGALCDAIVDVTQTE